VDLASVAGCLSSLPTCNAGLLRRELVGGALLVGRLASFAPGDTRFFRGELMGSSLLVRGPAPLTRDLALLRFVHARETPPLFFSHNSGPFSVERFRSQWQTVG
jgi:hypothetical protein